MVDNLDWLGRVRLLDFLRDVGKHFAVNQMIQRDSVKARFESRESGISYTEFSYMLLQAYDFHELHRRHGCRMQSARPISGGTSCRASTSCRRLVGRDRLRPDHAAPHRQRPGRSTARARRARSTSTRKLTSPFAFYQFWLNTADADVGRFLRWLTVRAREEIEALEAALGRRAARAAGAGRGPDPAGARR